MPGKRKSAVSCSSNFCGLQFCTTTCIYNGLLQYILWGVHSSTRTSLCVEMWRCLWGLWTILHTASSNHKAAVTTTVPCTSIMATWAFTYLNDAFFFHYFYYYFSVLLEEHAGCISWDVAEVGSVLASDSQQGSQPQVPARCQLNPRVPKTLCFLRWNLWEFELHLAQKVTKMPPIQQANKAAPTPEKQKTTDGITEKPG